MEQNEVKCRETEILEKQENLREKSRKNQLIRDTVAQQIQTLEVKIKKRWYSEILKHSFIWFQTKLEEFKLSHKQEETKLNDEINLLEDKLFEVSSSLESRLK